MEESSSSSGTVNFQPSSDEMWRAKINDIRQTDEEQVNVMSKMA
jgi:hypothetical protein